MGRRTKATVTTVKKQSDKITTAAGLVLSMIQASDVNLERLVTGDTVEAKKLGMAVGFMVLGWLTNKNKTTPE
jgi:hypothetical protein